MNDGLLVVGALALAVLVVGVRVAREAEAEALRRERAQAWREGRQAGYREALDRERGRTG